jgi:hypothetical protein
MKDMTELKPGEDAFYRFRGSKLYFRLNEDGQIAVILHPDEEFSPEQKLREYGPGSIFRGQIREDGTYDRPPETPTRRSHVNHTNRIVRGYIWCGLDREMRSNPALFEPNIDRILKLLVSNRLENLMWTFRIEDYTEPEIWQDRQDPTMLRLRFSFQPTRDFDWTLPTEWITHEYQLTSEGARYPEEEEKVS